MSDWKDFPRLKDKVAIVGFAPTTRLLAPFDNPEYEIWIVNEEYNFSWCKRFDRVFQMHQEWDFNRTNNMNDANHPLWLRNSEGPCRKCEGKGEFVPLNQKIVVQCDVCKGGGRYVPTNRPNIPIYMHKSFDYIPGSVKFPLDETTAMLGRKYYRSSFAYMLSLAMLMDYKRIELYGFEMGTDTEYNYQKPNGEWMIGFAQGKGFDVYIPEACTLLTGPVYGYEDSRIGMRQNLEIRTRILDNQVTKLKKQVERSDAQAEIVRQIIENPEWKMEEVLNKKAEEFSKSSSLLNFVRGAKREVQNIIEMYDKYFTGPSESVDPIAYNYKITEENVKVEYAQEEKPA